MDPVSIIVGIKTAIDLTKSIKDLADDVDLKSKTAELYDVIIGLQGGVMTIKEENYSLLTKNHELSQKIMEIDEWKQEKCKYSLHEICSGVFVYSSKKTNNDSEPQHWLCQKCYNESKKFILQKKNAVTYVCHNCGAEIINHSAVSTTPTQKTAYNRRR